jgi:predicted  nucleic acid-binding Zn-ribbon protein
MTKEEQLNMEVQILTKEVENLKNEIASLEAEKNKLEDEILDTKIEYDLAKYVITIEVERDFSMEMDALDVEIPVSKEFYDSIEIGTKLTNEYIMGNGDHFEGWFSIVVTHKEIR